MTNNSVKLNSGFEMPLIGLGTFQSPKGQVYQAVYDAIEAGYRHIDCAYVYGNEEEVGEAINKAISGGLIKREELFVTSKLWITFFGQDRVPLCLARSLKRLKLTYLDLYLIHQPFGLKSDDNELVPRDKDGNVLQNLENDFTDTWKGMEDVQKQGLVKSIGVSNFNTKQIDRLLSLATIKPAVNQVELHPHLTQKELLKDMKSRGISVTGYCPLGATPMPDNPLTATRPKVLENAVVLKVASNHGKQAAQVLIRYQVQQGVVCIPKSVTKTRIKANCQVFDFQLTDDEMTQLDGLNTNFRICPSNGALRLTTHRDYPY